MSNMNMREKERERVSEINVLDLLRPSNDEVNVILHNDDRTPMEFVVALLHTVFQLNEEKAFAIMLKAHKEGTAVIGTYSLEVAETKIAEAKLVIQKLNMPLKITLSEV